ncbi:MAG: rhomboid family intramembrane serine protease [Verrucomicrobiia bacterium]
MRLIGHIKESSHAAAFGDFLSLEGIENDVEREDDGTYSVWAHDEEEFEKATQLLSEFQKNPNEPKYHGLEGKVRKLRAESEREAETKKPVMHDGRDTMDARRHGIGQLTLALIVFSGVVFVLSNRGSDVESIMFMFIKSFSVHASEYRWFPGEGLADVREGQVWRLVTPIFIHFGFLHILFNMMWLKQLGSEIEHIQGKLFLGAFILITAVASNFCQYYFSSKMSPVFGGMSGVVFGLFGFAWMKTKFDFMSGYAIDKQTTKWMLIWFAICFTNFIPIANTAHTVGLAIGVAWGYASARGYFLKRK